MRPFKKTKLDDAWEEEVEKALVEAKWLRSDIRDNPEHYLATRSAAEEEAENRWCAEKRRLADEKEREIVPETDGWISEFANSLMKNPPEWKDRLLTAFRDIVGLQKMRSAYNEGISHLDSKETSYSDMIPIGYDFGWRSWRMPHIGAGRNHYFDNVLKCPSKKLWLWGNDEQMWERWAETYVELNMVSAQKFSRICNHTQRRKMSVRFYVTKRIALHWTEMMYNAFKNHYDNDPRMLGNINFGGDFVMKYRETIGGFEVVIPDSILDDFKTESVYVLSENIIMEESGYKSLERSAIPLCAIEVLTSEISQANKKDSVSQRIVVKHYPIRSAIKRLDSIGEKGQAIFAVYNRAVVFLKVFCETMNIDLQLDQTSPDVG